jgi:uncharacterized membrane protein YraQ (UPF0718 family)
MTEVRHTENNEQGLESNCCGAESSKVETSCCEPAVKKSNWRASISKLLTPWSAVVLFPILVFIYDRIKISEFFEIASSAFLGTLPFIIFAVLLIAYLKASGAEAEVGRAFKGRQNKMIVFAAFFGGLAPFCSCEVIPFIAGLLAIGTPLPAVMAFWLSSPLIDPPSLLITAGALGWPFAIARAMVAVGIGLTGGFALKFLMTRRAFQAPLKIAPKTSCCDSEAAPTKANWRFWQSDSRTEVFKVETQTNFLFLVKWLMFAYVLEALFILYIPAELVGSVVGGDGLLSVVIGAAVGMPAYLNGYAAPALVSGFMEQGMSSGAAMAFMTAGAISSIPAMTAVWSLVNRQVFAAYIIFGFTGAVLFGWLFGLLI